MALVFDRSFDPAYGIAVPVIEGVARVTCANPSPFTFHGTNSYLIGGRELIVLDPGPDDAAHRAALVAAIDGRPVKGILLTHTHRDHSTGARALADVFGAPVFAEGRHRAARPMLVGGGGLDASGDTDLVPDELVADGAALGVDVLTLRAIATPGHCANHMAYALEGHDLLFSGDHVMGWSTSIVAPPDGAMADYMASLDRLIARPETCYAPGHGGVISDAPDFARELKAHRLAREAAVLERLVAGDRTIPDMVRAIYVDTPVALHGAAALSLLAHVQDLVERGIVVGEGVGIAGLYRLG